MLVRGKYVCLDASLAEAGIKQDWAVYIQNDKICETGAYSELIKKYPDQKVIGDGKQWLMPGLIDAHMHGVGLSHVQKGVSYDYLENSLLDFMSCLDISPEASSMLSAVKHIRNGCTTIHHNSFSMPSNKNELKVSGEKIKAYEKTGIRLGFSLGIRNKNILAYDDKNFYSILPAQLKKETEYLVSFDAEAAIEDYFATFEQLYRNYNRGKTRVFFGPNWVQGSTDEFLHRIKLRSGELGNIPIHLHCLQTPVQKCYGIRTYGKSLVGHLADMGLVDENLVLGHAVYLNEEDIVLLAKKKSTVTHHPSCNLIMRNGIAPVYYMMKAGLNVAMGIDDKCINDNEDAIMEMRMIYYLHRQAGDSLTLNPALTPYDVIKIATMNGSKPCGFENKIGILELGKQADMILVDLQEILDDPCVSSESSIANVFVHRALGCHVNTVIIGGSLVMENRKILTIDVDDLYKDIRKQVSYGISSEKKKFRDLLYRIKPYYQEWYNNWLKDLELKPFYNMNSRL